MSEILFKELKIEHIIKLSLKNSYISVLPNANIVVKTPKVSTAFIEKLLIKREGWIRKQLVKLEKHPVQSVCLEDEVMLFGDVYSIDSKEAFDLRELLTSVKVSKHIKILKCYDEFYMSKAKEYLSERVEYYSELMNLRCSALKFKKLKSRWGSCDSNGIITLNTKLMKVKKEYIDYVVVHELSHLVHMNHSKKFHDLVDIYIKDSRSLRKEFRNTHYE